MTRDDAGWWRADVAAARPGTATASCWTTVRPAARPAVAAAAGRPDGPSRGRRPRTPSAWRDRVAGRPLPGAVLYELHIGTFTPEGTFDAAAERLDHLAELGVTHVELMPVCAVPRHARLGLRRRRSGPCTSRTAARTASSGSSTPPRARPRRGPGRGLQPPRPVRQLPARVRPVLHRQPPHPVGRGGQPRRRRLRRGARATSSATRWPGCATTARRAAAGRRARAGRRRGPRTSSRSCPPRSTRCSAHLGRPLFLIAESDLNDPRTVTPREAGGLGLHAQWSDDFHHALHTALTGERRATTPTSPRPARRRWPRP